MYLSGDEEDIAQGNSNAPEVSWETEYPSSYETQGVDNKCWGIASVKYRAFVVENGAYTQA